MIKRYPYADRYPTEKFEEARVATLTVHEAYLAHVGTSPDDVAPIEGQDAGSSATEPASPELTEKAARPPESGPNGHGGDESQKVAERESEEPPPMPNTKPAHPLDAEDDRLRRRRLLAFAIATPISFLLSLGFSSMLAASIARNLGLDLPWVLYTIVVASCVAAIGWWVARAHQLVVEAYREPNSVPTLRQLGECYAREVWGAGNLHALDKEQAASLAEVMDGWVLMRREGKAPDQCRVEYRIGLAVAIVVLGGLAIATYMKLGRGSLEDSFVSVLAVLILLVMAAAVGLWSSEVTLGLPQVSEIERIFEERLKQYRGERSKWEAWQEARRRDERIRLIEAKTKADIAASREHVERAKAQGKQAAHDLVRQQEAARDKANSEKAWERERQRLLGDLKARTQVYEQERDFKQEERISMKRDQRRLSRMRVGYLALAGVMVIAATYPAAVTVTEILGAPYQYPLGVELPILLWVAWVAFMAVAEWALVTATVKRRAKRYELDVLQNRYREVDRAKGKRYLVADLAEMQAFCAQYQSWLMAGVAILGVEFAANLVYMLQYSEYEGVVKILLPVLPTAVFAALVFPLAEHHLALHWLDDAVGPNGWKHSDPLPRGPGSGGGRAKHIRDAGDDWRSAGGFRDPSAS